MANGRWQIANYRRECTKVTIIPLISLRIFRLRADRLKAGHRAGNYENSRNLHSKKWEDVYSQNGRVIHMTTIVRRLSFGYEVWGIYSVLLLFARDGRDSRDLSEGT